MNERYDPEEIKRSMDGIMECQLEWEATPETAQNMLQLVPSLYAVSKKDALTLYENIGQLGKYMTQMGQMMAAMQRRLDDLEARQAQVTICHGDVRRIQALIRYRADEICRKYDLQDAASPRIFRAAIKKDVLKRYQVKDLHDIPETAIPAVDKMINGWVNIRLAMERRAGT